jgi:hypothetical protein
VESTAGVPRWGLGIPASLPAVVITTMVKASADRSNKRRAFLEVVYRDKSQTESDQM